MVRFQDISIKYKLLAIIVIASALTLLILSGGPGLKLVVASAVGIYFVASFFQGIDNPSSEAQRSAVMASASSERESLLDRVAQYPWEGPQLEKALNPVLLKLTADLELRSCSVALFDARSQTLNVVAHRASESSQSGGGLAEGLVLPLTDSGLSACNDGEAVYFSDISSALPALAKHFNQVDAHSVVCIPLLAQSNLVAVLFVEREGSATFDSDDFEFLQLLGERLAPAVHQARLYSELEYAYTELRQTQQSVMQRERLKALGQMASGIAHDVNNAVSPIIGFSDLLARKEPNLSSSGQKYLQHIRTAGDNVAGIVSRLRGFYRRRDPQATSQSLDLNEIVRQVVDATRPCWQNPNRDAGAIQLETKLAAGLPRFAGHEGETREALSNLILNAVEALPEGGKITIATRISRFETSADGGQVPAQVTIDVVDTGVGMNVDTRQRCLEPFFTSKGRRGAGLGLATVYGIMERHEGSIEIASALGQGSTFSLQFPIRESAAVSQPTVPATPEPEPMQILCIDDEPLLRELIKELLECNGHKVEVSDTGQHGIDSFREARAQGHPFDVVITDLGMPQLDGREVAKILKAESPGTPIVMLTGWSNFVRDGGLASTDVDGVISKPPRAKDLLSTLQRVKASRAATK